MNALGTSNTHPTTTCTQTNAISVLSQEDFMERTTEIITPTKDLQLINDSTTTITTSNHDDDTPTTTTWNGNIMETFSNDLEIIHLPDDFDSSNDCFLSMRPYTDLVQFHNKSKSTTPSSSSSTTSDSSDDFSFMPPHTDPIRFQKSKVTPSSSSSTTSKSTMTNPSFKSPEAAKTSAKMKDQTQMQCDGKRKADFITQEEEQKGTNGITNSTSSLNSPMNAKRRESFSSPRVNDNITFDGGRGDGDGNNNPYSLGNSALSALFIDTSEVNMYFTTDFMNGIYSKSSEPETFKISNTPNLPASKTTATAVASLHTHAERDVVVAARNSSACSDESKHTTTTSCSTTTFAYKWTKEEDVRLSMIIKKYKNPIDWKLVAEEFGGGRT